MAIWWTLSVETTYILVHYLKTTTMQRGQTSEPWKPHAIEKIRRHTSCALYTINSQRKSVSKLNEK